MRLLFILAVTGLFPGCKDALTYNAVAINPDENNIAATFQKDSWQYFLQHLAVKNAPVLDYTGKPVANQAKHFVIINYDVGTADLQQCADALMRLRAEYLFAQHRYNEIGFHFCNGQFYSWTMYCEGLQPVLRNNNLNFVLTHASESTHQSLRNYLDIVYAYANTVSLCKELKAEDKFEVGTVIIIPGCPGHTCIIVDEATTLNGEKVYKLAEGYMPAQSIYILSNPFEPDISPWYHLKEGVILTSSYQFTNYQMKKFE
jgi:hypothetical protein